METRQIDKTNEVLYDERAYLFDMLIELAAIARRCNEKSIALLLEALVADRLKTAGKRK